MNKKLTTSVTAAMLAALPCIATMVIKVPTIGTNGYVNIGDSVVVLSMWILGNPYGALAAGIGSGLADLRLWQLCTGNGSDQICDGFCGLSGI